jgi:type I restriction enzyme S subunit
MKNNAITMQGAKAISAGYKKTELGVIPNDWEIMLVGDAFTICNNLRLPISLTIRNGMNGDYPYYGPTKIQGYINEYRVSGEFALIGEDGDHFLKYESVPQTQLATGKFNVNNHAHLIKGKIGSAQWFYWFYRNRDISVYLTRQGAGRFKLNKASLQKLSCIIPPIAEQTAIVNALSDAEKLIIAVEQLIAKKQAIKTATMQQLLTGRTRLPQFSKYPNGTLKGYKLKELGHIPVDWEIVTCGEIGKFRGGNGFPTSVQGQTSGKYPFYKVSDMNNNGNGIFMSDSNNWISSEIRKKLGSIIFPAGSIIFAKVGAAIFLERKKILTIPSCIDNNLSAFELNLTRCDIRFIHYILLNLNFGDYVSTTALPSLSGAVLSQIKIVLPSISEQKAITAILSDMDDELEALEKKLAKIRDIKQGMMQQLLTGRIRLPLEQQP